MIVHIFVVIALYVDSINAAANSGITDSPEFSYTQAFSSGTDCGIIPFTQWAGDTSKRTENLETPVALVVIQHTVSETCDTDDTCKKIVLYIRDHHIKDFNFTDIGNSFYIGGNGAIYEGAGWHRVGAHTRGYNDKAISISFIGNFSNEQPIAEALQAAQGLIACGVNNNYLTSNYELVGHRQLSPTLSPGDSLQRLIETWPHWTKSV